MTTIDHFIPDKYVGLMIGKGGESISKLQEESGAKIQISTESNGPQRTVTISGTEQEIEFAKRLMQNVILNAEKSSASMNSVESSNGQQSIEIPVPAAKVGLVIGKSGETIRNLQEKAGVRMFLIQDSSTASLPEKPLRVTGSVEQVRIAHELVMELLNSKETKELTSRGPNDLMHELPVPRRCVGVVIGKGGDMLRRINRETGARVQFKAEMPHETNSPERQLQISGSQQAVQMAIDRVRQLISAVHNGEIPVTDRPRDKTIITCQVPADKAGLVIGKGGETVKEINRATGAYVSIQREPPPSNAVKVFDIQGSIDQINEAKRMICDKAGIPIDTAQQVMPQAQYNPMTGQMDYTAAWADYYRRQGLADYADAILRQAQQQQPQQQQQPPQQQQPQQSQDQWQQWMEWQQWQNGQQTQQQQQPLPQQQQPQQQQWARQLYPGVQGAGWEQAAAGQSQPQQQQPAAWAPTNGTAATGGAAAGNSWTPNAWAAGGHETHDSIPNWCDFTSANR